PAPRPTETARAPQPASQPAAGGGWIRDLLRSASNDEGRDERERPASSVQKEDRSALHVVESLNSLSVDIARAIDHEASIDL
ncbi:hypothetical protein R0J91_20410, partial [Micrococcus sp. SIMBA_131]